MAVDYIKLILFYTYSPKVMLMFITFFVFPASISTLSETTLTVSPTTTTGTTTSQRTTTPEVTTTTQKTTTTSQPTS